MLVDGRKASELQDQRHPLDGVASASRPRAVWAVECRSAGYPCWCTIATERNAKDALATMKAIRRMMPTAQHRGTLQVAKYVRHGTTWIREESA